MKELAERAVACKRWRWMPGMLALDTGLRLDEMTDDWEAALPDLTDPATLGCLLALVREAHSDPNASVYHVDGWWWVSLRGRPVELYPEGATEAEALVAALEAAP